MSDWGGAFRAEYLQNGLGERVSRGVSPVCLRTRHPSWPGLFEEEHDTWD